VIAPLSGQTPTAQARLRILVVALAAALAVGLILHRDEPRQAVDATTTSFDDSAGESVPPVTGSTAGVGSQPGAGEGVTINP